MITPMFEIVFAVLFAMAFLWLLMIRYLFTRLERLYPEKWEELGRPALFLNNTPITTIRTFKFLYSKDCHSLGDPRISALANVMRVWFVVYLFGFFSLFGSFLFGAVFK